MDRDMLQILEEHYSSAFATNFKANPHCLSLDQVHVTWEDLARVYTDTLLTGGETDFGPGHVVYRIEGVEAGPFVSLSPNYTQDYYILNFLDLGTEQTKLDVKIRGEGRYAQGWIKATSATKLVFVVDWDSRIPESKYLQKPLEVLGHHLDVSKGRLVRESIEWGNWTTAYWHGFFGAGAEDDWKVFQAEKGIPETVEIFNYHDYGGHLGFKISEGDLYTAPDFLQEFIPWLKERRIERQKAFFAAKEKAAEVFEVIRQLPTAKAR